MKICDFNLNSLENKDNTYDLPEFKEWLQSGEYDRTLDDFKLHKLKHEE